MKKTLTFYEFATVCHKYDVEVDIPDGTDLTEWLAAEDEEIGLGELYGDVLPEQVSSDVEGLEVFDREGQLLLQY